MHEILYNVVTLDIDDVSNHIRQAIASAIGKQQPQTVYVVKYSQGAKKEIHVAIPENKVHTSRIVIAAVSPNNSKGTLSIPPNKIITDQNLLQIRIPIAYNANEDQLCIPMGIKFKIDGSDDKQNNYYNLILPSLGALAAQFLAPDKGVVNVLLWGTNKCIGARLRQ